MGQRRDICIKLNLQKCLYVKAYYKIKCKDDKTYLFCGLLVQIKIYKVISDHTKLYFKSLKNVP